MAGFKLATVADSISKISVSGVTVKDIDDIPTETTGRDVYLFPKPDGWVSGLTVTPQSQGTTATGQKVDIDYTMTYVLAVKDMGAGRQNIIDFYSNMVAKVVLVANAIVDVVTLSGAVEITLSGVGSFGKVFDPAGNPHPGTELSFAIKEFYEV